MQGWSKFKKTVVIAVVAFFGLGAIGAATDNQKVSTPPSPAPTASPAQVQSDTTSNPQTIVQPTPTPAPTLPPVVGPTPTPPPASCQNGTYINSSGVAVCSPYEAPSAPTGATARCLDVSMELIALANTGAVPAHVTAVSPNGCRVR